MYRSNQGQRSSDSWFRGGRGRGSRGRSGSKTFPLPHFPITSPVEDDIDIMEGLNPSPLQTITRPNKQIRPDVTADDLEYIGSYNWTSCKQPTMIVPGSPPKWLDRPVPYAVDPDVGVQFVEQNKFMSPTSPLLPLITAVEARSHMEGVSVNWPDMDFVTDRNQLRQLIRWITEENNEFRIDIQLAGKKTILMSRWEKRTREHFPGITYAVNFAQASTEPTPDCSNSTGHHRIVTYNMGGMKMAVRFALDAYLPDPEQSPTSSSNVDDLSDLFAATDISGDGPLAIADAKKPKPTVVNLRGSLSKINIVQGGSYVPQPSTVEMSTRSEIRQHLFEWKDRYPQLFLSQTAHHFLAIHNRGTFNEVRHKTLESLELKEAEKVLQPDLKKLVRALQIIQEIVIKHGQRGRLSLVYQHGVLRVFERTCLDGCLPEDVINIFE